MAFYGSIANIFYQWEALGVFDYLLPFLLVFAVVFGILSSTKFMGDNRMVYIIVAVVIGILSLRWQYFFSSFLAELFPRLGIGLAVLLSLLILLGLFIAKDERRYWGWGLAAVGFIIALIIFYQSFESLGFAWGYGSDTAGLIILGVLLLGLIIAVAASGGKERSNTSKKMIADFLGWRD